MVKETTATAVLNRIGHELKRSDRQRVQITFLPLGDGRSVVSFDPVPVSFKLDVARQLKIDHATVPSSQFRSASGNEDGQQGGQAHLCSVRRPRFRRDEETVREPGSRLLVNSQGRHRIGRGECEGDEERPTRGRCLIWGTVNRTVAGNPAGPLVGPFNEITDAGVRESSDQTKVLQAPQAPDPPDRKTAPRRPFFPWSRSSHPKNL